MQANRRRPRRGPSSFQVWRDTLTWLPPLSFLASLGRNCRVLALVGVGRQRELQVVELAVGQREAVEQLVLDDRQQFLVGEDDAVVALGADREDAAAEGVAAGVFEQGRVDAAADDVLVGFEGLVLADDAGFLAAAPVGAVDVGDEFVRAQAERERSPAGAATSPRPAKRGGTVSRVWPRNMAK